MKRFRKIFTMIITMALLINISICSVIVNGETVNSMDDISDYNFTNLIVFARFSDEEEFVDTMYQGETVRQIIDNSYNTAIYSVGDYYRNISSDKLRMNSVYLYNEQGSIKLSKPRGYYAQCSETNPDGYKPSEKAARMYELRVDWSNAVNDAIKNGNQITNYDGSKIFSYSDLDKNNDGIIDSVTVIYKNTTQDIVINRSDPLWNYKDYADYIEIPLDNGKKITSRFYVQIINNYDSLKKGTDNKQSPFSELCSH